MFKINECTFLDGLLMAMDIVDANEGKPTSVIRTELTKLYYAWIEANWNERRQQLEKVLEPFLIMYKPKETLII